jgi:hypothetical protein
MTVRAKLCHSGKRFLLIRNPLFSGSDWIPDQARYDDAELIVKVNGTE